MNLNIKIWDYKHFDYQPRFLVVNVDTLELLRACNCSAPAAWIQGLSFGAFFKSVASFCNP